MVRRMSNAITKLLFAFFHRLTGSIGDFVGKFEARRIDRLHDAHIGKLGATPRLVFANEVNIGKRHGELLPRRQGFFGPLDDGLRGSTPGMASRPRSVPKSPSFTSVIFRAVRK